MDINKIIQKAIKDCRKAGASESEIKSALDEAEKGINWFAMKIIDEEGKIKTKYIKIDKDGNRINQ